MALTTGAADARIIKWQRDEFREYVRQSGFKEMMGRGSNSVIRTKYETGEAGDEIRIPIAMRLSGTGRVRDETLTGFEEQLDNYTHNLRTQWLRNAVQTNKRQRHDTAFDLLEAGRDMLRLWSMDRLRDDVIKAIGGCNTRDANSIFEGLDDATAAERNTWNSNNSDRVLYGAATSNYNATFATALANVDTTADRLSVAIVRLAKKIAKTADPHIRPMRVENGREYFVMFADSYAFADLQANMDTINLDGRPRDPGNNPLFQGGDLIVDGVIIKEIPELYNHSSLDALDTAGASSARVGYAALCGAQALSIGWTQMMRATVRKEDDYGFIKGVGVEECRGVEKMFFNNKQHGMVSVFVATD